MSIGMFSNSQNSPAHEDPLAQELVAAIECFWSTLLVLGKCAAQSGTPYGVDLEQRLQALERRFSSRSSPGKTKRIAVQAHSFIEQWGSQAAEDFKAKTNDIKSLLLALAHTVQSVGSYDHTCTTQLEELSRSLASAAALDDIAQIKLSLATNVAQLNRGIDQINRGSRDLVQQLQQQIATYQQKLEFAESIAFKDPLTGLANRRRIEQQIEWNIQHEQIFSVVMFDLNHFKPVNDEYGHNVGDNLLKLFSMKLQASTRASDLLGRWGGDEFVAVLMCTEPEGRPYIERVKKTVFGKYRVPTEKNRLGIDLLVDASIGIAEWCPGEKIDQVVARADARMYENKKTCSRYR